MPKVDKIEENKYDSIDGTPVPPPESSDSAPSSDQADARVADKAVTKGAAIKGSKSWERDDFNRNRWDAQNMLKVELRDPRFVIRWVRDGGRSNVDRNLERGYEFVTYRELKNFNEARMRNGKLIDSVVRVESMVLMKLPRELNESKKRYLAAQTVDAKTSQQQFRDSARQAGVKVVEEDEAKDMPSAYSR